MNLGKVSVEVCACSSIVDITSIQNVGRAGMVTGGGSDGTAGGAGKAGMASGDGKAGIVGGAGRAGGAANSLNPPWRMRSASSNMLKRGSSNIFIRQSPRSRSSLWHVEA